MINNTETESSSYIMPAEDCYDENGRVIKTKYMLQFPDFTKHDIKMTKKKVYKFLEKNERSKHFRMEIQDTPYGCNIAFAGEQYVPTEAQKERFFEAVWSLIDSTVVTVKAFDFNVADNWACLEIWGVNEEGQGIIMYLHTYDHGVIEIGENGQ